MKNQKELLELGFKTENALRGSIFEGLFDIDEDDFIDSHIPLEPDDTILGELSMLGKRFYTLYVSFWDKMLETAPALMDQSEVSDIAGSLYCGQLDIFYGIKNKLASRYLEEGSALSEDDWGHFSFYGLQCAAMMKIINGLVSSRITANTEFVIKQGFKIVALPDLNIPTVIADFSEN